MPFKTTVNWLFNDMWCYLVIAFFDWKIGIFQQTVVSKVLFNPIQDGGGGASKKLPPLPGFLL